ncbi:MAG: hypothetical protein IPO41_18040 [Acidobacteria bacterium]|nr:hypothetical protein [Acidobacteriota bacterium]
MPAANKITNTQEATELGSIVADALRILGFNMDFAPVVDVINDERAGQKWTHYPVNSGVQARMSSHSPELSR